jgi:serine-type D-Ala-D-Ala carboxypeptidase/endopeptidase (penicillin-binding protein 4)
MKYFFLFILSIYCSISFAQITQKQIDVFLNDTAVRTGHAGISVYDPSTKKYLYNYNAEKNFVPSSNMKLFSMYAGMKYLGDSLAAMHLLEDSTDIVLYPTGDPTLLHPDFLNQPLIKYLSNTKKNIWVASGKFTSKPYGNGWAWNDYPDDYMAERSAIPVYGNIVSFSGTKNNIVQIPSIAINNLSNSILSENGATGYISSVDRDFFTNSFTLHIDGKKNETNYTPFITSLALSAKLLSDSIHKNINPPNTVMPEELCAKGKYFTIYSTPTDSILRPMMHISDNFFAEQTLQMVSSKELGYMNDAEIIETLLKKDFKDLPQKPRWVDGSGLSRYNLFSPKDFIFLLEKMKNEFGMDRIKGILPTAGQGTLKGYYENLAGAIYAKTGSMSANVSLSGYLYTKKKKMLIFSVHINGYAGTGRAGRKAIEKMLQQIRDNN